MKLSTCTYTFFLTGSLLVLNSLLAFPQPLPALPTPEDNTKPSFTGNSSQALPVNSILNFPPQDQPKQIASPVETAKPITTPSIQNALTLRQGLLVYKYPYTAINPSPQNNPSGKEYPGFRGANQVVIYTSQAFPGAMSAKTGTNTFGAEAIIRNGIVQSIECCDNEIPPDGMVISAHGSAGEWLKKKIQPGMVVVIDESSHFVLFQNTPEAIVKEASIHLENIKAPMLNKATTSQYQDSIAKAEQCVSSLSKEVSSFNEEAARESMEQLKAHAKECSQLSDQAYYQTVQIQPDEFRGIWLRPLERTPEQIEQTLNRLKALKIKDIFIETYYQGKTIYPSRVMESYGLSNQHARFKGMDPLAEWVTHAHQHGIKIHVWSQIFFAGNKDENAELYGPILSKHPEWANIQRASLCPSAVCKLTSADTVPSTPGYSSVEPGHYFIDPANPEARQFLQKLLTELAANYDIDGLNFDYIRYPATYPVLSGSFLQSNWGYTPIARKQFMAMLEKESSDKKSNDPKTTLPDPLRFDPIRLTPSNPLWDRWVIFRKEQVSSFVQETGIQLRQIKPNLYLSAVVFPLHDKANTQIKLQDWPRWVSSGWLNALTPIGLYPTPEGIFKDSMMFREVTQDKVPVYVGIFGAYNRLKPSDLVAQIDAAHQAGMPGIMLFENSRLSQPYRDALQQGPFRE